MAQTWDRMRDAAKRAQKVADLLNEARNEMRELVTIHDAEPLTGAGDDPSPSWVKLDTSGNLKGEVFTPAEYLALVSFCREYEKLLTNQEPGTGFWGASVAKLISPRQ